jgi:transcription initiation factor TFIIB
MDNICNMNDIWEQIKSEKEGKGYEIVDITICDICNSNLKVTEEGFYCCSNNKCGIIYKNKLDMSCEWRFYGNEDNKLGDPTRCGIPINPLLSESSFGCKISCNSSSSYEMKKIRRYTEWLSMPYKEKSKYDDFQIITTYASMAGISKLFINDAIRYYNIISGEKTFRGLNREGILAASIYISFSINNNPRTAKEIAVIFKLDNTSATKGCKNAVNILNIIEENKVDKTELNNSTPSTFIDRYCSQLGINEELTKLSLFIACIVEKNNLIPENTPHSISSGIIYFVSCKCNLKITRNSISLVTKISEVTINKCYKKLVKYEDRFLPRQIKEKYNN